MIQPITTMKGAFSLNGQNAVVTGGNRGIGLSIADAMAQAGANVAILCRDMGKAEEALEMLKPHGGKYEAFSCDVADLGSVRKAVAETCSSFGGIDVLVNNAGVTTNRAFLDMDENLSDWRRVIDTDLHGVAHMTYEVGKRMRDAGRGGAMVNITSVSGIIVHRDSPRSPYNASKAGVNHFTHAMAVELGRYNIRVNAIAPGYIRAGFTANPTPEFEAFVKAHQPLDRLGEAIEVGALAVFLASPAAAHLTGTIQILDGGFTLS
ncbi:MAG: SDR family oxidoreductase [Peptococcaceae bacterium]|jgi:NAD(P)-dependent dehydrogenase (short-subunit alcohol dehydrogenase family)|nr:SDR family oxidoreductase [Peptococcaceae bacterium]